ILRSWNFYENCGVHTLILEDGTKIHMLAKRKYSLIKETLERMLSLKLITESASESAYNLLRFIQKKIDEYGSYDGKQTASGKDFSNPLTADSLPKLYGSQLIMLHSKELVSPKQTTLALAILEQTATGKEISNLFMADSFPKTTRPT
ncbi:hypothetical protein Tco_0075401, partial [Tanacetum coccineum]